MVFGEGAWDKRGIFDYAGLKLYIVYNVFS